jgi:hypothetical protein
LQDLVRSQLDELQSFISDTNEELKREFTQETLPEALIVLTKLRLKTQKN